MDQPVIAERGPGTLGLFLVGVGGQVSQDSQNPNGPPSYGRRSSR